ncbi:putative ribonuclease H-like domain-containing protein [Tanacetum coccineum]
MQSPYRKQSRIGLEATRNQRRCRRPFSSRIMKKFAASSQEGLDKTYDRFQKLISQLEIHGEVISQEDANLKLLRSLPSAWNNIALIMRNKSDLDTLSMDDLYNNLKVNNKTVNTAHSVSAASSKDQASTASYADDIMFSFFSNPSNAPQLDNEDLEQIDADDLEEMDLKWQVTILTMRVKRVPRNQGNRNRDNPRSNASVDTSTTNALVVQDGISGYDWSFQAEEGITNFALMAYTSQGSSSSSSSNSEVHTCSKDYLKSYETFQKQYDQQREALNKSNLEIIVNDRFKKVKGYHVVPPPYLGNYIPSRPDLSFAGLDDFVYKTKVSKTITTASKTSKDSLEKPKTVRNFVSTAVTTKPGLVLVNATKQSSPRAAASISTARPVNTVAPKPKVNDALQTTYSYFKAHSLVTRPFNQKSTAKTNNCNEKVNTAKVNNVTTIGLKAVVSAAEGNRDNVDQGIFNSGCPRHMTGNKSYLSDYQDIDGGFVAFVGSAKGGKITSKGKIKTEKLDFKDMYFVKELKFNLFSVLQMRDKKNSVFFTDTECVVLSPDFKLLDESRVLLKVPRNNNMCSFDLKNVVPLGGYSINSKAFRVFNTRTRFVEENLHINFLENKPNVAGTGPNWMFDIDTLTMSMNYQPVFAGNQTNGNASTKANINKGQGGMKTVPGPQYVLLPFFTSDSQSSKSSKDKVVNYARKKNEVLDPAKEDDKSGQGEATNTNSTNRLNTVSSSINIVSSSFNTMDPGRERAQRNDDNLGGLIPVNAATLPNADLPTYPLMFDLEDTANLLNTSIFSGAYDDEDIEPKKVTQALTYPSWIEAMQDELLQFRLQKMDVKNAFLYGTIEEEVYVCQPPGFEDPQFPDKVYKVEKALYGLHQAPRAWYETLSTYLVENGFRKGTIDKTLFIKKDKGDILLVKVYVDSIIFGSTKNSLCTEFESLMHKKFQISSLGELTFFLGLQVRQRDDVIFISQDKYVADILNGQVLWIPKSMLDYVQFMKPRFAIDDKSTIEVKNSNVSFLKPSTYEIRHHFIKDSYENEAHSILECLTPEALIEGRLISVKMQWIILDMRWNSS